MIHSVDEWSPLQEVIVGNPINANLPSLDLSFKIFFHDNIYNDLYGGDIYFSDNSYSKFLKKSHIKEHEEDIDNFVKVLEGENIKVRRPIIMEKIQDFKTPHWKGVTVPALNVRDQVLIIDNQIIETAVQVRTRYFENDLLKPLFMEYFKEGARWICAPKPMLLDDSFDLSYIESKKDIDLTKYEKKKSHYDMGYEIFLDAAQCLRFGKNIVANVSNKNHLLGIKWLKQHLGSDFEIHICWLCDNHIDSAIMPLKEGSLLVNRNTVKDISVLPHFLHNWDIIDSPEPIETTSYDDDDLILASKYIDVNVLSIDGDKIIVNGDYLPLIRLLEQKGFTPIPVRLRHKRLFAGGFHCITLDTVRER